MANKRYEEISHIFSEPLHDSETLRQRREEARVAKEHRRYKRYVGTGLVAGSLTVYLFLGGGLRTFGLKAEREYHNVQGEPTCLGAQTIVEINHTRKLEALEKEHIDTPKDFTQWNKIQATVHRTTAYNTRTARVIELHNPPIVVPGDEVTLPKQCED